MNRQKALSGEEYRVPTLDRCETTVTLGPRQLFKLRLFCIRLGNEIHPHYALNMNSPRMFRRALTQ